MNRMRSINKGNSVSKKLGLSLLLAMTWDLRGNFLNQTTAYSGFWLLLKGDMLGPVFPIIKAYWRFGKTTQCVSVFVVWRASEDSIYNVVFCSVEQCSQSQTCLLISWTQMAIQRCLSWNPLTIQSQSFCLVHSSAC